MRKKKLILLLTSLSAVLVSASVLFSINDGVFSYKAESKPSTLNCDYYFDDSYTSIYEINDSLLNSSSISGYKSWGTISCVYHNNANTTTSYFVQSTDAYGRNSGLILCNNQDLKVGNVITFSGGTGKLYNNHPQIQSADASKDYDTNPSPIVCRNVTYEDFIYDTTYEKNEKIIKGSTLVRASGVTVSNIGNQSATLTFDSDSSKTITAYYGSTSETNYIKNRFSNYSGVTIDVMGHIAIYNSTFQLYVRSDSYISTSSDGLSYITATCEHGEYETYETPDIEDFIVTAHYGDGTSEQVFTASIDSWDYIEKYVRISYTEDGVTKYVDVAISVHGDDPDKYIISVEPNNPKTSYIEGETYSKPQLKVTYNTGIEYISTGYTCSEFDSSELGRQSITITYEEYVMSYDVIVHSEGNDFEYFDLNADTFTLGTKVYDTGNYGECDRIGYYRVNNGATTSTFDILPYDLINDAGIEIDPQPGAIYSDDPFEDIKRFVLKYSTSDTSGDLYPALSFGENSYTDIGTINLIYSNELQVIDAEPTEHLVNYFKIESGDTTVTIHDIYIEYYDTSTTHGSDLIIDTNYTDYRVNPEHYSGYKSAGYTSVSVPIDVTIDTTYNTYIVNEYKTYTYYDLEYAQNHSDMASEIALTDPVDIANYYNIYGEAPANYAYKSDLDECIAVFGSDARLLQRFTNSSGYAQSVPYNNEPDSNKPVYYEFDIALSSSYDASNSGKRGVGRVVAFEYGFRSYYDYDSSPVCLYTDNHYSTFQEFNNLGGWGHRFDVQSIILCRQWKQATIVSEVNQIN